MKKILIILFSLVFINSCEDSPVEPSKDFELIIDIPSFGTADNIESILIENGYIYIKDYYGHKRYSLNGRLIETYYNRKIDGSNSHLTKKIKGGYYHLLCQSDSIDKSRIVINRSSNEFKIGHIVETDTFRLKDTSIHFLCYDYSYLVNNTTFTNKNQTGFFICIGKNKNTLVAYRFYSSDKAGNYKPIATFKLNDEIFRNMSYYTEIYSYKDKFLFKSTNLFVIDQDGTYNNILPDEVKGRYEIFEYDDKLFINNPSKDKTKLFYTSDFINFNKIELDFEFNYAGQIGDLLIGKVDTESPLVEYEITAVSLETKKYSTINLNYSSVFRNLTYCNKVIEYQDYTYFVSQIHVYKIKTDKITFGEEE